MKYIRSLRATELRVLYKMADITLILRESDKGGIWKGQAAVKKITVVGTLLTTDKQRSNQENKNLTIKKGQSDLATKHQDDWRAHT